MEQITLKPNTRKELQTLLKLKQEYDKETDRCYELRSRQKAEFDKAKTEHDNAKQTKGEKYSSNNTFELFTPSAESEYYSLKKEADALEKQNFALFDQIKNQLQKVAQTFIEEYDLNSKHAKILTEEEEKQTPNAKRIYHSTGVVDRDIHRIAEALVTQSLHPGRFTINSAGIATYWGDENFFEGFKGNKHQPAQIIEARVDRNARLNYVGVKDYNDCNLSFYKRFFNGADFKLLQAVESSDAMHVRSIFDVAMGYSACVRLDPETKTEIWAIYDRSILGLEKEAVKNFEDVFSNEDGVRP